MFQPKIDKSTTIRIAKKFNVYDKTNKDYDSNDLLEEFGLTQFSIMGSSKSEFQQFDSRGNPSKMGLTIFIYKIIQCCNYNKIIKGQGTKKYYKYIK
jgi:hypothetical protein